MLNQFFKFSSLLSILFIIYGVTCNYIYYNAFGINIIEYIDLGEATLLFVPFLKGILLVFILLLLGYFIFFKETVLNKNHSFYNHPINIKFRNQVTTQAIVLFILLPAFFILFFTVRINYLNLMVPIFIIFLYGPYFFDWLFQRITSKHGVAINEFAKDFIIIGLIFSTLIIFSSYRKIFRVTKKKDAISFNISFKSGQTINSDSSTYYLGRTTNYIFVYFSQASKTKIFNVGDIDHVEFSK